MTYADDLKRLHQYRIEALESKVEELEAKIEILTLNQLENENR
tara:strand:- start:1114 stop:1242 length:129 start_codon:yes stop_codon:yes gene_type:complete